MNSSDLNSCPAGASSMSFPTAHRDLFGLACGMGGHRLTLLILVITLALRQNVKHSAVPIDTGSGLAAANIADDALARSDPFEDRVWHICWAMATDGQHPSLPVGVTDPQDE